MKILIIEDKDANRKLLEIVAKEFGEYRSTAKSTMAIKLLEQALDQRSYFDIIILDIKLTDMKGTSMLWQIRELEEKYKVPEDNRVKIVAVTGNLQSNEIMSLMELDCDDYLIKPLSRENIIDTIKEI